jgi:hydrogenase/urease accessory protein HupE
MEHIAKYIFVGIMIFSTLLSVKDIGKDRKPLTPMGVMFSIVIQGILIALVLIYWN